jgi:hypothetical protein
MGPLLVPEMGPLLVPLFATFCALLLRDLIEKCANGARFWDQNWSHFCDQKWSRIGAPNPFNFWHQFGFCSGSHSPISCSWFRHCLQRPAYRGFPQTHYPQSFSRPYFVRPPPPLPPLPCVRVVARLADPHRLVARKGPLAGASQGRRLCEPGYVSLMGQPFFALASFQHASSFTVYSLSIVPSGCGSGFGTISGP